MMAGPLVRPLRRAVVLGSGVMGSRIAALLAGIGVDVDLLDLADPTPGRSATARVEASLATLTKSRPAAFYLAARDRARIHPGTLESDLECTVRADWVIEAVVEDLAVKRTLWRRIFETLAPLGSDAAPDPGPFLSTNTSGLPLHAIFEGLGEDVPDLRARVCGAHFFNPPRYMRLVEVIPLPDTVPETLHTVRTWAERDLGKSVVEARDTPDFIANRIGAYALHLALLAVEHAVKNSRSGDEPRLTVDVVDALTGPVIGHPSSATFRTLDLVGLDTSALVADGLRTHLTDPEERRAFEVPGLMQELIARGLLGEKTGAGFYRRVLEDTPQGPLRRIEVIDLETFTYRPRTEIHLPSLDRARSQLRLAERLRTLAFADDSGGRFVWHVLSRVMLYAARHAEEIAGGDLASIDQAMRSGYEWELGPFETWAALGLKPVADRLLAEGETLPAFVRAALEAGQTALYDPASAATHHALPPVWRLDSVQEERRSPSDATGPGRGSGRQTPKVSPIPPRAGSGTALRLVRSLGSSTWVDLGQDVLGCLVHPDHHAIGPGLITELHQAARETEAHWRGLVIVAPSRQRFLIGANLALVLAAAEEGDFDTLEESVRALQTVHQELRYLSRPVVAAPLGLTLGGGAELCLAADRVVTSLDWTVGQVEVGAGLIPAGGGMTALLRRTLSGPFSGSALAWAPFLARGSVQAGVGSTLFVDPAPVITELFQTLATARTAQSAAEARELGFLTDRDRLIPNPESLLDEARRLVLDLDRTGYRPPAAETIPAPGREVRALLEVAIQSLRRSGLATQTDAHIASELAHALTGGDVATGTGLPESHYLDLEREGFLRLAGETASQERMRALLRTGKPLRN